MSTHFQEAWLIDSDFKTWVRRVEKKPTYAYCLLCRGEIFLSNMGRQALRSHMKGKKHLEKAASTGGSILLYATQNKDVDKSGSDRGHQNDTQNAELLNQTSSNTASLLGQTTMNSFALKNEVTEAEIMWCMHTVMSHKSLRSSEKDVSTMSRIFSDSEIAKKMQLKKDKIGYIIIFGIAPFFKAELMDNLKKASFLVIGFDESLNKIT